MSDLPKKQKRIEVRKLKKLGVNQKYINLFIKLLEYIAEVQYNYFQADEEKVVIDEGFKESLWLVKTNKR